MAWHKKLTDWLQIEVDDAGVIVAYVEFPESIGHPGGSRGAFPLTVNIAGDIVHALGEAIEHRQTYIARTYAS